MEGYVGKEDWHTQPLGAGAPGNIYSSGLLSGKSTGQSQPEFESRQPLQYLGQLPLPGPSFPLH